MRINVGALILALSFGAVASATQRNAPVTEASKHLRKACEVVWTTKKPVEVERCTERAMAALSEQNRLRDNQLKRFLYESEQELKSCKTELAQIRVNLAIRQASKNPDTDPQN